MEILSFLSKLKYPKVQHIFISNFTLQAAEIDIEHD